MPFPLLKGSPKGLALAGAAVLAVLLGSPPEIAASADPEATAARHALSGSFGVDGTHGYRLDVESERGVVMVVASERQPPVPTFSRAGVPRPASRGNGAASIYRVRVPGADPRRIDVRLGRLGRIAVGFRPSGRTRVTRLRPGTGSLACGRPVRVVRRLGHFVGTVEFRGEGGYTSARATRVAGSVGTPLTEACAAASRSPRALLSAVQRRSGTRFEARTAATGASFLAVWREPLGDGIVVSRRAYAGAPRSAFAVAGDLSSARVTPPAPFTGSARFDAGEGGGRWVGNLAATFPGAAIPMTGPGFRSRLVALR